MSDPVDAVILAYLDHLEGAGPAPSLDHLGEPDRARAAQLMAVVSGGHGIDPRAPRPSIEALLADTPLAGLIPALNDKTRAGRADLKTVCGVLADIDARARVEVDGASVVLSYLDLRARFVLVPAAAPTVTRTVRGRIEAIFRDDPDTSRVGVVAAGSPELSTQLVSVDDVADTITTPRGARHTRWEPPLPLTLAARRLLEQSAPEWPPFDFDRAFSEPLDVAGVAAEIAGRIIERESTRSYRGDKRRAYRALVGHERLFADLVARVSTQGRGLDLDDEITKLTRAAA
jgi:hypothetical protein